MYPLATNLNEFRDALAKGKHPHAGRPSDSPYADCSVATIDINGDHIVDEYEAGKGLDAAWDVLVGRILYYGEDSSLGRYSDVDANLRKTIDYDNASPEEILQRYQFEIDGNVLDGHVVEWAGFPYLTRAIPDAASSSIVTNTGNFSQPFSARPRSYWMMTLSSTLELTAVN